ncbi:hypothetical protein IFM89_004936 [Coptis chinensis]|uniref:Uncharacterized protein n=1 Tax=Coptis chinensis TaxID=261450 RepID=A0A835HR16_9MAGN|nr:hypothetical protein IFM89_004936 [Coptis chinensis]
MRVAVIGVGISGLVSAYVLAKEGVDVLLYEKEDYLGGHATTVTMDGVDLDLGFMIFNRASHYFLMFSVAGATCYGNGWLDHTLMLDMGLYDSLPCLLLLGLVLYVQSKMMVMAVISFAALIFHTFFSWLLMLKLGWGLVGAAVVPNASWWFINGAQLLYIFSGTCGRAWSGFSMKAFENLWGFVRLSIASTVML